MRHFHAYSQVFWALLFLLEASALAQTTKPVTKAQPEANSPVAEQANTGPIKAVSTGRSDPYKGYKFLIRSGTSTVAGFAEYTEIGNAARPSSGEGKGATGVGGSQVPVTVPGSLVGSNGSLTLNCTPSSSNGPEPGVSGKAIPRNDAWTITLTCAIPYDKVTLQRGFTQDPDFMSWISGSPSAKSRDLTVEAVNESAKGSFGYRLSGCTVGSAAKAMPELKAGANATNIAALELHCAAVQRY